MLKKSVLELQKIQKEVARLDPSIKENSATFKTAVMLLSALQVGANEEKVMAFTGFSKSFVTSRARRLRKSGIWDGDKTACEWFGEDGGIAFWADVCVAEGLLQR